VFSAEKTVKKRWLEAFVQLEIACSLVLVMTAYAEAALPRKREGHRGFWRYRFMSWQEIGINLGDVDLSSLQTEDDYRKEAQRLLPKCLTEMGEAIGERSWDEMQKSLKQVPGVKVNTSSSEKRKFVKEAGQNFAQEASDQQKREIVGRIIQQLRRLTGSA
jgi:hypothetical protein